MMQQTAIAPGIFRAYDIRGIVGQGLDANSVYLIGQAIGSEALDVGETSLIAGADARLSSPELSAALIAGIRASGCDVIDLGIVPTPLLYFATHTLDCGSGVMLTGSHNPRDYNGIKIVLKRRTLADNQILRLRERIESNFLRSGRGQLSQHDILAAYLQRVCSDVKIRHRYKVVLDAGNGVGGLVAPKLFSQLGCKVIPLHCVPDGNFPNHHPDPTRSENLDDLIAAVQREHADLGIALDGDADRVGLVTSTGKIINADQLLLAFVLDIVPENPGAKIVFDVKSSHHLSRVVGASGGFGVMCKSGHSFVKQKLFETEALLGGEFSAHIFFKHRWYGFDDGIYVGARFLELMSKYAMSADMLMERLPQSCSTPELFAPVSEEEKFNVMATLREHLRLPNAVLNYLDGIRADYINGWALVRASNTTPALVLRFEADNPEALAILMQSFKTALLAIEPRLQLPF